MMRLCSLLLLIPLVGVVRADKLSSFLFEKSEHGRTLKTSAGKTVLQYMTVKPKDSKLTASSTCCFYPVLTPKGTPVVDFAPDDHLHHRGIFLAWHNIQGKPGGDFWGWGEHAPTEGRVIRNKSIGPIPAKGKIPAFQVRNEWMANSTAIINETLTVRVREVPGAYLLDLHYALVPTGDLTLGQTAFSGFNVKSRKAKGTYTDPEGEVKRPNPHYLKPKTDWPSRPWYDYTFELKDGTTAGVTVIDHKDNPATTWHNLLPIAMLNPCIVAPSEVKLTKGKALHLRYRLVVHDGPAPVKVIADFAREFAKE